MKRLLITILLFFSTLFSLPAFAQQIPVAPTNYINDYAHLLSSDTVNQLNQTLQQYEQQTSNQIVVAIFPGKLTDTTIEDFSVALEEKWKIGQKNKDNGMLLVIFPEERQLHIEVGYGLEGAIPDTLADLIIRQEIVPAFKQQQYDQGVTKGVQAIMQAAKNEYQGVKKPAPKEIGVTQILTAVIVILIAFFIIGSFFGPAFALFFCISLLGVLWGVLFWLGGFGLYTLIYFLIPAKFREANHLHFLKGILGNGRGGGSGGPGGRWGGGSNGGFGGGGGGSSGGGGASGRW